MGAAMSDCVVVRAVLDSPLASTLGNTCCSVSCRPAGAPAPALLVAAPAKQQLTFTTGLGSDGAPMHIVQVSCHQAMGRQVHALQQF